MVDLAPERPSSNYAKYQTTNPVVRRLIEGFFSRLQAIVEPLDPDSLLDAGCGEGETLAQLGALVPERVAAIDLSAEAVEFTARRFPTIDASRTSIYELPFEDASFDLVLCLEVLEHLDDPVAALSELHRVSARDIVISVPHEPWFRLGSLLRGKYLKQLGNHPEHINHWGPRRLEGLLSSELELVDLTRSFPWLIAHCRRPSAPDRERPEQLARPGRTPPHGS